MYSESINHWQLRIILLTVWVIHRWSKIRLKTCIDAGSKIVDSFFFSSFLSFAHRVFCTIFSSHCVEHMEKLQYLDYENLVFNSRWNVIMFITQHTHTHSRKYTNGGICVIWVIDIWSCDMFLLVILYAINIFLENKTVRSFWCVFWIESMIKTKTRIKETDKKLQQIYKSRQQIEKWVDSFCCCS